MIYVKYTAKNTDYKMLQIYEMTDDLSRERSIYYTYDGNLSYEILSEWIGVTISEFITWSQTYDVNVLTPDELFLEMI